MSTPCTYDFDGYDWSRFASFVERVVWMYREERPWRHDAACLDVDTELFFQSDPGPANAVCGGCPVRLECLDYALRATVRTGDYQSGGKLTGVWGGFSERQRRDRRG